MLNSIYTTPRFERKIDLLDKRLSLILSERFKRLETEGMKSILDHSYKLNISTEPPLWVTRISNGYRLIFRIADANIIEMVDIVSRDELSKFSKEMK